jgi:cytochrome P450
MNRNAYRFTFQPLSFLHSMTDAPDGVVELGTYTQRRLLVWQPDAIAQIFRSDRHMRLATSDTLSPLTGDTSLLFANGTRHAAYRRVLGPPLRGRRLDAARDIIRATTRASLDQLAIDSTIRLPAWTRALTMRVIGQLVLGATDDGLFDEFTRWVNSALGSRGRTLAYRYLRVHPALPSPWRTFLRRRRMLAHDLLHKISNGSLAGLLLAGGPPLGTLTEHELLDQVISLLFAGHETTASAIAWTLYWLERNDEVRRDICDELAGTDDDGSSPQTVPLLDAACRESLRISPPAVLAGNRILTEDTELLGARLPVGTRLTPCIYLAHHRHRSHPRPASFQPCRFLGASPGGHEFLPFGGGTRRCLGAELAMLELRMVVAAVLRCVTLRCLNPQAGVPHLRGPAMGPGRDLTMAVTRCPG